MSTSTYYKMRVDRADLKRAFASLKPQKTIWGVVGVVLFFIAPEVVAFFYAGDIVAFANSMMSSSSSWVEAKSYEILAMLFEDGVSYLNLALGFILLAWLFI